MMNWNFIGVIAKQAEVPIKTIRYYEDVGLLPKAARTSAGYRLYDQDIVDRLQFIKKALHLITRRITQAIRGGCPPRFRPHGKAVCPTIERQPLRMGSAGRMTAR